MRFVACICKKENNIVLQILLYQTELIIFTGTSQYWKIPLSNIKLNGHIRAFIISLRMKLCCLDAIVRDKSVYPVFSSVGK